MNKFYDELDPPKTRCGRCGHVRKEHAQSEIKLWNFCPIDTFTEPPKITQDDNGWWLLEEKRPEPGQRVQVYTESGLTWQVSWPSLSGDITHWQRVPEFDPPVGSGPRT